MEFHTQYCLQLHVWPVLPSSVCGCVCACGYCFSFLCSWLHVWLALPSPVHVCVHVCACVCVANASVSLSSHLPPHPGPYSPLPPSLPLFVTQDIDFFQHLEMHMRAESSNLVGRDHLSFRSSYVPCKVKTLKTKINSPVPWVY